MKTKIYMLTMLMALVSISAFAQRGGRGHFAYGGGRISSGPRVSVGVGFYGGGALYHSPGFYHGPGYYRPYYHYYGPPIGFRLGILPYGFLTFNTGFGPYYYSDGTFYQPYYNQEQRVDQYQVVDPPMGVVVPKLPKHTETVTIDGNTYYQKNGTLYQEIVQDNVTKYVVVGKNGQLDNGSDQPQEQDQQPAAPAPSQETVLSQLPSGSRGVEINGQQLYVSPDGMYYQEVTNADNSRGYKIVGKMSAGN
jgi:hypothetical protein